MSCRRLGTNVYWASKSACVTLTIVTPTTVVCFVHGVHIDKWRKKAAEERHFFLFWKQKQINFFSSSGKCCLEKKKKKQQRAGRASLNALHCQLFSFSFWNEKTTTTSVSTKSCQSSSFVQRIHQYEQFYSGETRSADPSRCERSPNVLHPAPHFLNCFNLVPRNADSQPVCSALLWLQTSSAVCLSAKCYLSGHIFWEVCCRGVVVQLFPRVYPRKMCGRADSCYLDLHEDEKKQVKMTLHCFDRRLSHLCPGVFRSSVRDQASLWVLPRREIALISPCLRWIGADEHADWPLLFRFLPPFRHRLRAVIHRD